MVKPDYLKQIKKITKLYFKQKLADGQTEAKKITVGWPIFDEKEILNALDSLLNLQLSQGPKVKAFEVACARYINTKFAVAVNSGSSANLIALASMLEAGDLKKNDEVIIPAATFATVASPIIQLGLTPVYVDVDPDSWNIDPREIAKAITKKTRLIMPVHSFGNPAAMEQITRIAKKHGLLVLEDCCEAHGAKIGEKKVGSFGRLATLSFFVAHNITTGEGGMVFTNSRKYRDILASLREFGRLPAAVVEKQRFSYPDAILKNYDARYIFTRLGYNLRMTDIEAALGIEQLKKLDSLNKRRLKIVAQYQKALKKYSRYLQLPKIRPKTFHSFYGYCFLIKAQADFTRQQLTAFLEKRGIETRTFFGGCLPDQPAFRHQPGRVVGRLPVSRAIRDRAVFIGCHPGINGKQIQLLLKAFADFFKKHSL